MADFSSENTIHIGDIVQERYRIEAVIGHGSMGTTYKATDVTTRRHVAVKLLHFSRVSEWKALEMFEREARILQQLHHQRIPTYIDYFSLETEADTQFLLVQEYIEGKTIEHLIEGGWRGSKTEILDIFWQLVNILDYLHSLQPPVIHRDINPRNIILTSDNLVHLVDFGAVQERIRTTFLGGSTIVGTYGYVPYEQFSGQTVPASDYYAAGATLLFMLTHRHPSDFPTKNMKPDFHAALTASPDLHRLLDGLFEPNINKRIASPKAVKKLLKKSGIKTPRIPKLTPAFFRPSKTNIQRVIEAEDHLTFIVPKRQTTEGVKHLAIGGILLSITFPSLFVGGIGAIFGLIGLGITASGLDRVFGKNILQLTPEWIEIRRKCFQFEFGKPKRIQTALIGRSDVTGYDDTSSTQSRWKKSRAVLGITHKGQVFEIGTKFTKQEAEWLTQEINEYVDKYAKALK